MLKKLTILSLFILILPFFQTCSDKNLMTNSFLRNSPISEEIKTVEPENINGNKVNNTEELKEFHYTFKELKEKKQKTIEQFLSLKKEMTMNGYELGFLFIEQLEIKDLSSSINYALLPFFLTLIISVLLVLYTFKNNLKIIIVLAVLNLVILILQLILEYKSEFLEDIEQIKFGYYLFVINLFLIIFEAYKQRKIEKTNAQQQLKVMA